MHVANPIDPSFPTIRYLHELGPASSYPGAGHPAYGRAARATGQRGQLSAVAGIVLAAAAFGAGFFGGFSSAAAPARTVAETGGGAVAGEFRLGPGNLTPPGIVRVVDGAMPGEFRLAPGNLTPPGVAVPLD